jgi:hypothetical protein
MTIAFYDSRKDAKNAHCHFDRREKSFLDPSHLLGMTGIGPSLGARRFFVWNKANSFMSLFRRGARTGDEALRGAAAHAMLVEPSGRLTGAIKTGNYLAVHIDYLALRIDS